MDSKITASSEPRNPQSVTTNAEDDPLLALAGLFSGVSLDGHQYVEVPMSRPLTRQLHINQLNDYCLLALFNQFPLQEQLKLRPVCRQWKAIIEQKCQGMQALKIFSSNTDVRVYCSYLAKLKLVEIDQMRLKPVGKDDDLTLWLEDIQLISSLFENIHTLVYFDCKWHSNVDRLAQMFQNVTSMTISASSQLFSIIGSFPKLTCLRLIALDINVNIPDRIPMFLQLESFTLAGYYGSSSGSLLKQLGSSLKRLSLSDIVLTRAQLQDVFTQNSSIINSVTHLTLVQPTRQQDGEDYADFISLVCATVTNVEYLHLNLSFFARLTKLAELHIDELVIPAEGPRQLALLPSVKQLHITFQQVPTIRLHLQRIFTSMERVFVYYNENKELVQAYMAEGQYTCPISIIKLDNPENIMGRPRDEEYDSE